MMSELLPIFSKPESHAKGWGEEIWITNNSEYCGKILRFNAGASFSMHYHLLKKETFFILKGVLNLEYYNLQNASVIRRVCQKGDVIHLNIGTPHKLTAIEDSEIIEFSTTHYEEDSYRVLAGDSQK